MNKTWEGLVAQGINLVKGNDDGVFPGTTDHGSSSDHPKPVARDKLYEYVKKAMDKAREEMNDPTKGTRLARGAK